jgi:hypothetical protein
VFEKAERQSEMLSQAHRRVGRKGKARDREAVDALLGHPETAHELGHRAAKPPM